MLHSSLPTGWHLQVTTEGTTATEDITLPSSLIEGTKVTDGTLVWKLRMITSFSKLGYRQPSTYYREGQIAYSTKVPEGYYLECTTTGTTAAGDIASSSTIGNTIQDGTVKWKVLSKKINMRLLTSNVGVADLNLLRTIGIYRVDTSTSNRPDDINYGVVMVNPVAIGVSAVAQILYSDTGKTYYRYNPEGSSGSWQQLEAIVAKSLTFNGYIKYASGVIMQWSAVAAGGATTGSVTLPISFTGNWSAYVAFNGAVTGQSCAITGIVGNDQVNWSRTGSSYGLRIIAIGY